MDGAVGLPGTACRVQPLQGMGAGPGVEPGPQLGVGEVLQGLREQRVGSSGPHGGERPRPGPAGDGDLPEDEGGGPGAEEGGRGCGGVVPARRVRRIRVRRVRRVQALAEQSVPRLRASGEHRAHPGPVGGEGTVVRGGVDAAHGRQVAGRVAHHPGRLGRPEERVEGPPGVVRAEQRGRGEEGFMGIGGGPGTQGEQAVDVGGEAGRGGVLPRRPGPGQQGTGPGRVTGEGGLFGRRGEPGRAQGLFGGERGGAGEGRERSACGYELVAAASSRAASTVSGPGAPQASWTREASGAGCSAKAAAGVSNGAGRAPGCAGRPDEAAWAPGCGVGSGPSPACADAPGKAG
ncbi:hypothetical protein ACN24M_31385 [Streptomyces microflavus]